MNATLVLKQLSNLIVITSALLFCNFSRADLSSFKSISLLDAVLVHDLKDTTSQTIKITPTDYQKVIAHWPASLRPEFEILVLSTNQNQTLLALVHRKNEINNLNFSELIIGQPAVQWQTINIDAKKISGIVVQNSDGPLKIILEYKNLFGLNVKTMFETNIILAKLIEINKISYNELIKAIFKKPLLNSSNNSSLSSDVMRKLFGQIWIKIISPKGELNSFEASSKLLQNTEIINPNKEKVLHRSGQVFTAELFVDSSSPFSGRLAAGKYFVVGRLSSALKNLNIYDENGNVQSNSLAIGLLLFRTQDQAEQPGILFLQDSLVNIKNPFLKNLQMTNNPRFSFEPNSTREFFEQGATVMGVAFASFLNSRDSGRNVEGNYRSNFGATSEKDSLINNNNIKTPRYIALEFFGNIDQNAKTIPETLNTNVSAFFKLRYSDDDTNWINLGTITNIVWQKIDSHELTFPHGFSGAIDPFTLQPMSSGKGPNGLALPNQMGNENVFP